MICFGVWFIFLVYGYVLVVMIYLCGIMGVGCSEMLLGCALGGVRLWGMEDGQGPC